MKIGQGCKSVLPCKLKQFKYCRYQYWLRKNCSFDLIVECSYHSVVRLALVGLCEWLSAGWDTWGTYVVRRALLWCTCALFWWACAHHKCTWQWALWKCTWAHHRWMCTCALSKCSCALFGLKISFFICRISGRVDRGRAAATETINLGSILGRVKPNTIIKIGIYSFPTWRSRFSNNRGQCETSAVCGRQVAPWL